MTLNELFRKIITHYRWMRDVASLY